MVERDYRIEEQVCELHDEALAIGTVWISEVDDDE